MSLIRKKINALSGEDAKTILDNVLWNIQCLQPCDMEYGKPCPYRDDCGGDKTKCMDMWFKDAWEDAQI